jgi:hypothetical protein
MTIVVSGGAAHAVTLPPLSVPQLPVPTLPPVTLPPLTVPAVTVPTIAVLPPTTVAPASVAPSTSVGAAPTTVAAPVQHAAPPVAPPAPPDPAPPAPMVVIGSPAPAVEGAEVSPPLRAAASEQAREFAFPFTLVLLVVAFLALHGRIDRSDARLATAPVDDDRRTFR